jgi:uncharacterized protein
MELRPQAKCFVWQGWQSAIALLGLSELIILVKRAFDRRYIDPQCIGYEDFVRDLERAITQPSQPRDPYSHEFTLFGKTVEELCSWYGFSEEYHYRLQEIMEDADVDFVIDQPYRNPFKGIGRNDRCPCGSGKKFKQCCLASPFNVDDAVASASVKPIDAA